MSQATSHTPFDCRVDTSLQAGRKCASISLSMEKKKHNLAQRFPFSWGEDDPFYKKQKMQGQEEVSKRKVLALYEDYLKKRVKETWPSARMGSRLFEEIKAKGYLGSRSTVKKFLHRVREESGISKETFLSYYKDYIKKSVGKNQSNCVSAKTLFNEITAKGYRGSFSAVEKFLWVIRKETKAPQEAFIQFHKEYLIKRVKDAYPKYVPGTELFKEIKAKGYQGTIKTVRSFLVPIHKSIMPKASLNFYKNYLIKRVKDALPDSVLGTELFEEIRAQGYRGSISTLQGFLSGLRKKEKRPREVSLDFHKGYLIERVKAALPGVVSTRQLFAAIQAKGYRGSIITLQGFLSGLRKKEKKPSEDLNSASVEFHKDYLTKRLEETYPSYVSGTQLLKEIRAKGYRGSPTTFRVFLSTLREQEKKPSEACVEFHEEYLTKRLKGALPNSVSTCQLFEEIRAKGYRGSLHTLQTFLSVLRKQEERPSNAHVEFHRDYLIKRLEETYPSFPLSSQLFKEIKARGYQGAFGSFQGFLSTLRKQNLDHTEQLFQETTSKLDKSDFTEQLDSSSLVQRNVLPEASLQFHKDYLIKILQENWPNCLPPKQLFEDIISRGYRGTCKEVEVFLMMISK